LFKINDFKFDNRAVNADDAREMFMLSLADLRDGYRR
jgi:hypothetical protein